MFHKYEEKECEIIICSEDYGLYAKWNIYYRQLSSEMIEEAEEDILCNYNSIRLPATIKGMSAVTESIEIELDLLDEVSARR